MIKEQIDEVVNSLAAQFLVAINDREALTLEKCSSIAKALEQVKGNTFEELVFQGKSPTTSRMNQFLAGFTDRDLSEGEREVVVRVVQHCCRSFGWQLYLITSGTQSPRRCTLSIGPTSDGKSNRFNVLASPGGRRALSSRKSLPELSVGVR